MDGEGKSYRGGVGGGAGGVRVNCSSSTLAVSGGCCSLN